MSTEVGSTPPANVTVVAAPYAAEGPLITGTSLTPNSIDTVSIKTFKIEEFNRSFSPGLRIRATATDFSNVWLEGIVTAWDGENLSMDGDLAAGAGVYSSWYVNVAGQPGQQGPIGSTGPSGPSGGPAGPQGPAGAPGSTWRNGNGAPSNSLGLNGDYYLNDLTDDVYLRTASVYNIVANIRGSTGAAGAAGAAGAPGPTGPQGIIPEPPNDSNIYGRRVTAGTGAWVLPPGGGDVQHTLTLTAGAGLTGGGDLSANRTFNVGAGAGITVNADTVDITAPVSIALGGTGATTAGGALTALGAAPIASPVFTGDPQAPTPATADNDTSIATTAFVKAQGYLLPGVTANIAVGYTFSPNAIGSFPSAFTPNPALGNYQFGTNNGAFTFNPPASDCAMDIMITNGSAGAITFGGGWTVGTTGDPLDLTAGHRFVISIRRINAVATYMIKALQ